MPMTLPRSVEPTPTCHLPAFIAATFCGTSRAAARISAQVISEVEYDGVPVCMFEQTSTPCLVHASMSMCG